MILTKQGSVALGSNRNYDVCLFIQDLLFYYYSRQVQLHAKDVIFLRKKKLPFYLMSYLSNDKFVKFHREPALNKNTSITPVQEYFKICIDKSLRKHSILQRSRKCS